AGQQRLVVCEQADRADRRTGREHLDLLVEDLPLRGEDLGDKPGARHQSAWAAASTTCSIRPLRKNALSGRSSCLPSISSAKPRIVSAIGTYSPGVPVNCSATENGCERNRSTLRARWTVTLSSSESSSMPRIAMMSWSSR